jgi:hypothetical protein
MQRPPPLTLYPLERLPEVGLHAAAGDNGEPQARTLSAEEKLILQGLFVWTQVMMLTEVPSNVFPSHSELWWIVRLFDSRRASYAPARHLFPEITDQYRVRYHEALRHLGLAGWIHGGNPNHDVSDSEGPSPSPSHGLLHFDTVSFSQPFMERVKAINRLLLLCSQFEHDVFHIQQTYDFPGQ